MNDAPDGTVSLFAWSDPSGFVCVQTRDINNQTTRDETLDHTSLSSPPVDSDSTYFLRIGGLSFEKARVELRDFGNTIQLTEVGAAKMDVVVSMGLLNDTIHGSDNPSPRYVEFLEGTDGNDVIWGYGGNDEIHGNNDNDELYGGMGWDTLVGGDGDDYISGGDGNDTISGGTDNDSLYGDAGSDTILGGDGNDLIFGGDDADPVLRGGIGNDKISGGEGADVLRGDEGDDILCADFLAMLNSEADVDDLDGGPGEDCLDAGGGGGGQVVDCGGQPRDIAVDRGFQDYFACPVPYAGSPPASWCDTSAW
jgi:Ca2+-binding RTX toxin-like protein